jgi:sigma-B regulation protein RsbU (phosphoserine phosphatase)
VPRAGPPERLEATAPPLGLAAIGTIQRRQVEWKPGADLLVLWTDGLVDALNDAGESFGETRLLDSISSHRTESPEAIVQAALEEAESFGGLPNDDRTLLVMRI